MGNPTRALPQGAGLIDSLDRLAGTVAKWLLAVIFLLLPLNALRPFKAVALADVLIALLLPIAFILFLTRYVRTGRIRWLPKWLWIGTALLLLSIVLVQLVPPLEIQRLSFSFDEYGVEDRSSMVVGIRVIFALVAFPIVISLIVDRWSTINLLVTFWIVGVSISCAVALIDKLIGTDLQSTLSWDPESIKGFLIVYPGEAPRMVGLTDHPNTLSLTAVMASPLVMSRMKSRQGLLRYGPALLLIAIGVMVSGARAGVIGLALAVILTLVMDQRFRTAVRGTNRRTLAAAAAVFVVMVAVLWIGVNAPPQSTAGKFVPASVSRLLRPADTTKRISDRERVNRLNDSVGYIKERPVLGYGFEWVETSHNTVLQLTLAGGIIALVAFFMVLLGYLKIGFGLRKLVPPNMEAAAVALTISLLLYVLSGLVVNHIFERYLYIPTGLILALFMLQKGRTEDRRGRTGKSEPASPDSGRGDLLDGLRAKLDEPG